MRRSPPAAEPGSQMPSLPAARSLPPGPPAAPRGGKRLWSVFCRRQGIYRSIFPRPEGSGRDGISGGRHNGICLLPGRIRWFPSAPLPSVSPSAALYRIIPYRVSSLPAPALQGNERLNWTPADSRPAPKAALSLIHISKIDRTH